SFPARPRLVGWGSHTSRITTIVRCARSRSSAVARFHRSFTPGGICVGGWNTSLFLPPRIRFVYHVAASCGTLCMIFLLRALHPELLERHLLPLAVRRLDHEPASLAMQRELLLADLTEHVHALPGRILERAPELVLRELRFESSAKRLLRT